MIGSNLKNIYSSSSAKDTRSTVSKTNGDKKISFATEPFYDMNNWGVENLLESNKENESSKMNNFDDTSDHFSFFENKLEPKSLTVNTEQQGDAKNVQRTEHINKYLTSIFELPIEDEFAIKNSKAQEMKDFSNKSDKNDDMFLPFESDDIYFNGTPGMYNHFDFDISDKEYKQALASSLKMMNEENESSKVSQYPDHNNSLSTNSSIPSCFGFPLHKSKTSVDRYDEKKKRLDQLLYVYKSYNTPSDDMNELATRCSLGNQNDQFSETVSETQTFNEKMNRPLYHPLKPSHAHPVENAFSDKLEPMSEPKEDFTNGQVHYKDTWDATFSLEQLEMDIPKAGMKEGEYNLYKGLLSYLKKEEQAKKQANGASINESNDLISGMKISNENLIDLQNNVINEKKNTPQQKPTMNYLNDDLFMNTHNLNSHYKKDIPSFFDAPNYVDDIATSKTVMYPAHQMNMDTFGNRFFDLDGQSNNGFHSQKMNATTPYGTKNYKNVNTVQKNTNISKKSTEEVKVNNILKNCIMNLIQNGDDDIGLYESLVNTISDHHKNKIRGKGMEEQYTNESGLTPPTYYKEDLSNTYGSNRNEHYSRNTQHIYNNTIANEPEALINLSNEVHTMKKGNNVDLNFSLIDNKKNNTNEVSNARKNYNSKFNKSTTPSEVAFTKDNSKESNKTKAVTNVLFDEYYKRISKEKQQEKPFHYEYTRNKSDVGRKSPVFSKRRNEIDDELFSNLRNNRETSSPLKSDENTNRHDAFGPFENRSIKREFGLKKKSNEFAKKKGLYVIPKGTSEIRSVNKNLNNFFNSEFIKNANEINKIGSMNDKWKHTNDVDKVDRFGDISSMPKYKNPMNRTWTSNSMNRGSQNKDKDAKKNAYIIQNGYNKLDLKKAPFFSKYKGIVGDAVKMSADQLRPLMTKEDQNNLDLLLQSLYDDRILPLEFNLCGRAEEMKILGFVKNNLLTAYGLYPKKYTIKKTEEGTDHLIYFKNRMVDSKYFVYLNNLEDTYDKSMWVQFEQYLKNIAASNDPSLYEFSGGRYGMAKELKNRNLPFFEGLYLGNICHIIHLSTNKKLIAYEQKLLKPISKCHKFMNAKLGVLTTNDKDSDSFITSVEELRYYLNELLKYYRGGFNISTLKKKLKTKFNKQISESVFHCIKLIDVLQLDELKDVCIVDKELKFVKSAKVYNSNTIYC